TIEEIKNKVVPIAKRYDIPILYLFGSYARGEATEQSDIDLAYDGTGSKARGSKKFSLQRDLEKELGVNVDLLRVENFAFSFNKDKKIVHEFTKDRIVLYEKK